MKASTKSATMGAFASPLMSPTPVKPVPGRIRKLTVRRRETLVILSHQGVQKSFSVGNLVLEAFVGPRPEGMVGCHWDDDHGNNRLENLRWGARSDNGHDSVRNGTHVQARKTHCLRGHEYSEENTYRNPNTNRRSCRACRSLLRQAPQKRRRGGGDG